MSILAIIILSVIDWFGYNYWGKLYKNQYFNAYRIFIVVIQIITCVLLYHFVGFNNMILYLAFWWIGFADLLYYCIDTIIGNEKFFKWKGESQMSWLWFTPYGLAKVLITGVDINKKEFLIQNLIGVVILIILKILIK